MTGRKSSPVPLQIKHQTGPADFEKVKKSYDEAGWGETAEVRSYIDNMMDDFAKADLVICRAGATTTAELIAAGKASVMIPFPLAADDHQRKNAEALQASGAAKMILQKDLSGGVLAKQILDLAQNHPYLLASDARCRDESQRYLTAPHKMGFQRLLI